MKSNIQVTKIIMHQDYLVGNTSEDTRKEIKKEQVIYENKTISEIPFVWYCYTWTSNFNELDTYIDDEIEIDIDVFFKIGNTEHKRKDIIRLGKKKRDVDYVELEKGAYSERYVVYFEINKEDWEMPILNLIKKITTDFYFTEDELLTFAHEFIKGKKWSHFQTQVEIDKSIIDGLAFFKDEFNKDSNFEIIGFEAKTDKDNYDRLKKQINSYLTICDKVYLIIQSKEIPNNLPFYVGVIRVNEKTEILRHAQSLKHDYIIEDLWHTLTSKTVQHAGLKYKDRDKLLSLFHEFETIKRKMIWNQFVIGFKDYYEDREDGWIKLTDREKDIIQKCLDDNNEKTRNSSNGKNRKANQNNMSLL